METKSKILMVVSHYENDNDAGITIKSQLSNSQLLELVNLINNILHTQESETSEIDIDVTIDEKDNTTSNNKFGDPDLLKIDNVVKGSVIDPLKKS